VAKCSRFLNLIGGINTKMREQSNGARAASETGFDLLTFAERESVIEILIHLGLWWTHVTMAVVLC